MEESGRVTSLDCVESAVGTVTVRLPKTRGCQAMYFTLNYASADY